MKKRFMWALMAVVFVLCAAPRAYSQEMTAKQFVDEAIALLGSPMPADARNAQTRPTLIQRQIELQGMKMGIAPLPYPPKPGWFTFKSNIGLVDCTINEAYRNRPIQRLQVYFEYRDDYEAIVNYFSQDGWVNKSSGVYEKDSVRASRDNYTMGHDTLIFERFTPTPEGSVPGGGGIRIKRED